MVKPGEKTGVLRWLEGLRREDTPSNESELARDGRLPDMLDKGAR